MMQAAWEILSLDASIQYIFGDEWCRWRLSRSRSPLPENATGLLHEAHCLVTGIGDVQQSRHLALIKLYPSLRGAAESAGACADVCGYMFCGKDDYEAHREQLDEVNHRIVAPTLEDYVRATRRARLRYEGLGTMVLASGGGEEEFSKAKARAISAAISHGAINILCIDEVVARAIVNLNTPAESLI
jgi:DNA-binding transcriptional regulator LsrR (DeoR family)